MARPALKEFEPPIAPATEDVPGAATRSRWSALWVQEDYWAIWLGLALLAVGMLIYLPGAPADLQQKSAAANQTMEQEASRAPFRTIAWHQAADAKAGLKATSSPLGKIVKRLT